MIERASPIAPTPQAQGPHPHIIPVLVPHGLCGPGCPLCPESEDHKDTRSLMPNAGDIAVAMQRYPAEAGRRRLLAFYGGSMAAIPHEIRAPLLDAAEREQRSGRINGIRLCCDPTRLMHIPLGEWYARGVRSVEIPLLSTASRVLRTWNAERFPAHTARCLSRLRLKGIETGLQLLPGLPGDSHDLAILTATRAAEMSPDYVRILPAMVLEGTRLEAPWRSGNWRPMTLEQGVRTVAAMLQVFRDANIPVARIGLQPEFDLVRGPGVLDGPYHPALRHLVESSLFRRSILDQALRQANRQELRLRFHPADESYVRGPMNRTLQELKRRFQVQQIQLEPDDGMPRGLPEVEKVVR